MSYNRSASILIILKNLVNHFIKFENYFQIPPPSVSSRTDFSKGGVRGDYEFSLFVPACSRQGRPTDRDPLRCLTWSAACGSNGDRESSDMGKI